MIKHIAVLTSLIVSLSNAQQTTETFGGGPNQFNIEFVTIGNPGNKADASSGSYGPNGRNVGGVSYAYKIGKYEISREAIEKANSSAGLQLSLDMRTNWGNHRANQAATGLDWYCALRFVNYLNQSQGYLPAYKFSSSPGENGYYPAKGITSWNPSDAGYDPSNPLRNKGAKYFLPSADEWHKAAYYDPNKSGGGYWKYPTASDTAPIPVEGGTGQNTAVYGQEVGPADINNAGGLSPYGTMAQGGNVWEYQETIEDFSNIIIDTNTSYLIKKGWRGGAFDHYSDVWTFDSGRQDFTSLIRDYSGFRVASLVSDPQRYIVTLVTKYSPDLKNWFPFVTNQITTFNDKEFYRVDIQSITNIPSSP